MPSVIAASQTSTSSLLLTSTCSLQQTNPEQIEANSTHMTNVSASESERPIEILEDVKFAEQRHRVKSALQSIEFKHDLEAVLGAKAAEDSVRHNGSATHQTVPLTDIYSYGRIIASQIPINDIRNYDRFTRQEKDLRCKLASLCRLIALHGWTSGIYNHVSARIDPKEEHFLVNPFGVLYYELTASSLIKVNRNSVTQGNFAGFCHNQAIFTLHSAIHRVRPDVKCVVHVHSKAACTVSSIKEGLLPLSHEALLVGGISYHQYKGLCGEELSKNLLCDDLGPFNKILILRNHGLIVCAESIEETWSLVSNVMKACEIQCDAMSAVGGKVDSLILPTAEIQKQMIEQSRFASVISGQEKQLKKEELEFEASMRILDNAGMRTGYIYKFPYDLKTHAHHEQYECTIPAVQSSLQFADHRRPHRSYIERNSYNQKAGWLVSPNSYVKQHSAGDVPLSTGIKWSPNTSLSSSTPVKVPQHSFAPLGTNVNELKQKQEQMKENRVIGKKSAGPITEICRNIDQYDTILPITASAGGGCERKVIVGAASRAIVKKEYQDNLEVYKSAYSSNPFTVYQLNETSSSNETDHQTPRANVSSINNISDVSSKGKLKKSQHHKESTPKSLCEEIVSDSSVRASSPEQKSAERKKSSFRTPSFLKRTKKRSQSSTEKHTA
ncbi:hypothetical protein GJ496_008203 [Pomphorhynchus laevis]|nr:hypothetical protein GJ496_008203 [Pomphorhynchus laevis]